MSINYKLTFIVFALLTSQSIFFTLAQSYDTQVVATVGKNEIKAAELKIRFELSPFISDKYDYEMLDSLKMEFLYSLIAERILAREAAKLNLDTLDSFTFYFNPLTDILLRDRLFKEKISGQISVSDQEIDSELKKYSYRLKLYSILFSDSVSAAGYYNSRDMISFDSTAFYNENVLDRAQVFVTYGSMKDRMTENTLYELEINEVTTPVNTEAGWIVFKLINKEIAGLDPADTKIRNSISAKLSNEKIKKRYDEYISGIMSGMTINIERDAFEALTNAIIEIYRKKETEFSETPAGSRLYLSEKDFQNISVEIGADISKILFRIDGQDYKNFDFLSNLAFEEFGVDSPDSAEIISRLTQRVKIFIQQQMLTLEAYKNGIDQTDEYKAELSMWRNNYLSNKLKNSLLDSITITTDEIKDYYTKIMFDSSGFQLISLRMVSTQSLDEISDILEAINNGEQFGQIAKIYGKTNSFVNENGETGLKPAVLFGNIGNIAKKLNIGDLYGPVNTKEGYTVFELIDKKVSNDSSVVPFGEVKDHLYHQIRAERLNGLIVEKIGTHLGSNEVKIFRESVERLMVTKIPMFVHRMMGFGGRISAVPITNNWPDWQQEFIRRNINIP